MARLSDDPELTQEERVGLAQGRHADVAEALRARGRPDLAGRVYEAIWDFSRAVEAYLAAGAAMAALEAALASEDAALLGRVVEACRAEDAAVRVRIAETLQARGRASEAAALLADHADPEPRIRALASAGRVVEAAEAAVDAGLDAMALELLAETADTVSPRAWAIEARARWNLGDVEGAVRSAQRCLREGGDGDDVRRILSAGLAALGYVTAAHRVRPEAPPAQEAAPPARFRVTAPLAPRFCGAAYLAQDRFTLEDVEVHLLLADAPPDDPEARRIVAEALSDALAGDALAHPAVTQVRFADPRSGLLVLPHEGASPLPTPEMAPPLGLVATFFAFLAAGLAVGHGAGLANGGLLPTQFGRDALGRPRLPPFGVHRLVPLAGTQTAGLEARLRLSPPEVRTGRPWTPAADVYGLVRGFVAFATRTWTDEDLAGALAGTRAPRTAIDRLVAALASDPVERPTAAEVAEALRAIARAVGEATTGAEPASFAPQPLRPSSMPTVWVEAAPTWTASELDALAAAEDPYLQPVLDRHGRRFGLATWPPGSAVMASRDAGAERRLPRGALAHLTGPLRQAIVTRLGPRSLVRVPGGHVLVALDDVLTR
ncbi:MAG: hypothetical protein D6705_14510 [Deltaproteobacteria bacterium]|nr:MAG: hypothetical protein D6705_14510 [Deltaproteobacteria bacterium]